MNLWKRRNQIAQDAKDAGPPTFAGGFACIHCRCKELEHNTLPGENRKCSNHDWCPGYEGPIAKEN